MAILPLYAASFGVSYALVGLATSAAAIGTLVTDVPAGAMLSHIGLRTSMIAGAGLVTVCTLAAHPPAKESSIVSVHWFALMPANSWPGFLA